MSKEYDIEEAFAAIESELINSMMRNMKRHLEWEDEEDINWSMWQAEQLKALEGYKKANKDKFTKDFDNINNQIEEAIKEARERGSMEQELSILKQIKEGKLRADRKGHGDTMATFFRMNDRKMSALIKATTNDFEKAETAMLRMANDQYRQIIFKAQVYANSGAGTYEKAVDMATRDFISRGINCVEYSNGARHNIKDYARMAIRTASKRAYLTGEGEKRAQWGIHTVIVGKRGNPCPKCLPFVGKILIDDVYSGGSSKDGDYPLLSSAMSAGLYHPNCKDSHSTYFPGVTEVDNKFTKDEIEEVKENYTREQKKQYARRQFEKFDRLKNQTLDEEKRKQYDAKSKEWLGQYKKYYDIEMNQSKDISQFERYKSVLRDLSPDSAEEFLDIKYSDDKAMWEKLKYEYRTLNRYEVEGDVTALKMLELDNAAWYTKLKGFNPDGYSGKNRDNIRELPKSGNAAVMQIDEEEILFSHSKVIKKGTTEYDSYEGDYTLVGLKENRRYEVSNGEGKIKREMDTEAKFFEYLADVINPEDEHTITILSEKHMCESCRNVMKQFMEEFPNVKVNIVHGKRNYNGSEEGTKTWKHRKRK